MSRIGIFALVGLVLVSIACGEKTAPEAQVKLVSPAAFAEAMAKPGTVTLNVLGPKAPSIPGTDLPIPFDELSARSSDLPPASTELAVYCWSGHTSAFAVPVLERLGYTNIVELEGGMQAWQADGRKLVGAFR